MLIPACGGTEVPYVTRNGYKVLYVFDTETRRHEYVDCETDTIIPEEDYRLAGIWF